MLDRIGEREEVATSVFEAVPQRDQFLPAIDGDSPAKLKIALQLFRLDAEISDIAVSPDERMKGLDVGYSRSVLLPAIHFDRAGLPQLDGHDPRCWIDAEEQRVFLKSHLISRRLPAFAEVASWLATGWQARI